MLVKPPHFVPGWTRTRTEEVCSSVVKYSASTDWAIPAPFREIWNMDRWPHPRWSQWVYLLKYWKGDRFRARRSRMIWYTRSWMQHCQRPKQTFQRNCILQVVSSSELISQNNLTRSSFSAYIQDSGGQKNNNKKTTTKKKQTDQLINNYRLKSVVLMLYLLCVVLLCGLLLHRLSYRFCILIVLFDLSARSSTVINWFGEIRFFVISFRIDNVWFFVICLSFLLVPVMGYELLFGKGYELLFGKGYE